MLCQRVDASSLENCGMEMQGRSPDHSAARRAVAQMFKLRNAFMGSCQGSQAFRVCIERADWYVGAGMAAALNAPTLQSSSQR